MWEGNKPIHATTAGDDTLIALALAIYHRDLAIKTGESFLINEKGEMVEYDSSDSKDKIDEIEDDFDIIKAGEQEDDGDFFQEKYNVSQEQYTWLIR